MATAKSGKAKASGRAKGAKAAATKRGAAKRKPKSGSRRNAKAPLGAWGFWTLTTILGVAVLRLGINTLDWVPVHFDEGQYWAYGQELAWGHFSKPPLVGWVIYLTTWLGGDTTFALRIGAVAAHAAVAGLIYLAGTRLFDGRTGFWAAAGYTLAPGVSVSSMIMTTDPVMMVGWALALYAWIRTAEMHPKSGVLSWWAVLGLGLGLAMLAKYTALTFAGGALAYALFSARGRDWAGTGLAALVAALVFLPNVLWQVANDFATVTHVAEDAAPAGARVNPDKMAEFVGAQLGVIGPVWFLAIVLALWGWRGWRDDWRMRLLAWQTAPLILTMVAVAFLSRAHANWAAPAYVAGSILAAHWLLTRQWQWGLKAQAGIGALGAAALYAASWAYATMPGELPRGPDPFKKMRLSEPFCGAALAALGEEGAEVLLSYDRRRLSECMFLGGLTFQDVAVWNPGLTPNNHHELVATLQPGDERPMLLAVMHLPAARAIADRFDEAREVETGTFQTHQGRTFSYSVWFVRGFRGY
ncbi:MAG: glycosyltransferase family 39 protein [Pseudomonadota bacterium]